MVEKILRIRDLRTVTGLSPSSVYQMIRRGEFPAPIKLGRQAIGWTEADVAEWQASRQRVEIAAPK